MNFRNFKDSFYMYHKMYEITISPPHKPNVKPQFLFDDWKPELVKWLNSFSNHWILYPEFDSTGRLHFHGVFFMIDKIKFAKTRPIISRRIGFIKVGILKTFQNHLRYLIYCQKEYADTQRLVPVVLYNRPHRRGGRVAKGGSHLGGSALAQNGRNILDWFAPAPPKKARRGVNRRPRNVIIDGEIHIKVT